MTDDEQIEAVARAIYAQTFAANSRNWKDKWTDRLHDKEDKDMAFKQARAAIDTMRELSRKK